MKDFALRAIAFLERKEPERVWKIYFEALLDTVTPGVSKEEWENKLISYNYRCAHCGTTNNIEIDHIIPITLGGTNTIENLQPLCRSCNASKGGRYVG